MGERHGNALLTNQQAADMRRRYWEGEKIRCLASDFGVGRSTAYKICTSKTYKGI